MQPDHVVYQIGDPALRRRYERLLAASMRETRERLNLDADDARMKRAMATAHLIRESVLTVLHAA